MSIEKYDVNFRDSHPDETTDVVWYDVRKAPFTIYGLYEPCTEPILHRMNFDAAARVSEGVAALERHTSGGRVRFSTNSSYIAIRMKTPAFTRFSHMANTGVSGFDLYIDDDGKYTFVNAYRPSPDAKTGGFASGIDMSPWNYGEGWHTFTMNLPLYSPVDEMQIGIRGDCEIGPGRQYRPLPPIVFYGSSITQGGCASRPGNAYTHVISRRLDMDIVNLGFSGQGMGQKEMAEYIATLPMSVFVSDYDHNAPDPDYLRATHYTFYETIRAKQPNLPYLMVSQPNDLERNARIPERRAIIRESYERALANGDKNVYHIDGSTLFAGDEWWDCTVDGAHPNDFGFRRMADVIGDKLGEILGITPVKTK